MFKNYYNKSVDKNVFKSWDSIKSNNSECFFLNKYCLQQCYCEKDINLNITKYFIDKDIYDWEINVYFKLLNKKITPEIRIEEDKYLTYIVRDKVSIYNFLLKNKKYTKFVLNELYSFVNKFNKYNFLHGNLHLHNIFIDPDKFLSKGRFYIIDFSNSYIFKTNRKGVTSCPQYNRTSFMGEYDKKISNEFYIYWDFFTLYISLKMFLKNDFENLVYLENLIQNYMSDDIIKRFISLIS
jgi:hypothetical protein